LTAPEFDHVAQAAPDIEEAVGWYVKLLPNTRVLHQDETWVFIEAGRARIALVVHDQGPGHIAWRITGLETERMATKYGAEIKPHRDGSRSFYLDNPRCHSVEIICVEGSAWENLHPRAKQGQDIGNATGDSTDAGFA